MRAKLYIATRSCGLNTSCATVAPEPFRNSKIRRVRPIRCQQRPALSGFKHPERVHSDGDEGVESSEWKTGIRLIEVRWSDGMLTVQDLAGIVPRLTVLAYPLGTVFRINGDQLRQIEQLWIQRRRLAGAA
jgi:hypothetical protein